MSYARLVSQLVDVNIYVFIYFLSPISSPVADAVGPNQSPTALRDCAPMFLSITWNKAAANWYMAMIEYLSYLNKERGLTFL